jgi:hypothetical protein
VRPARCSTTFPPTTRRAGPRTVNPLSCRGAGRLSAHPWLSAVVGDHSFRLATDSGRLVTESACRDGRRQHHRALFNWNKMLSGSRRAAPRPGAVASLSQSATAAGRGPYPWSDVPDGCITRCGPLSECRPEPVSIGGSFVDIGELKWHCPLPAVGCDTPGHLERWGECRCQLGIGGSGLCIRVACLSPPLGDLRIHLVAGPVRGRADGHRPGVSAE